MKAGYPPGIALVALVGVAAACGSPRRGEPITGPLRFSNPRVERGEIAFMNHCQPCHPGGEGGLGPALNNKCLPGFAIKTQVRVGFGAMPGFVIQSIPPADLKDLVVYLEALRRNNKSTLVK
jgi:mono/diheme cytochrome c family protein